MARQGFIMHFSNLGNLKMMLKMNDERAALDAIIKAIEFDVEGKFYDEDEFESPSGIMLYNSLTGQIKIDKPAYEETCRKRHESGKMGGAPKEFLHKDVQALVNELHHEAGLSLEHFKIVRKNANDIPIYTFIDKNTERSFLQHSKKFNNNGTRKKGK